ncbi:MAG: ABC transporter permease [Anaerolineales bacterium]|nr:ABC transporter permease [Anaerolineales bacterium]
MAAYLVRRLLLLPVVLWAVTLMVFGASMALTPQQRAATYVQSPSELHGGAEAVERIIDKYGLDDPFHVQYGRWLSQVFSGNLGWSQSASMPVANAITQLLPATIELALLTIVPIVWGGIVLGSVAAAHHNRFLDHMLRFFSMISQTFPSFVFGLIALMVLYGKLGWFPPGRLSIEANEIVNSETFRRFTGMNVFDALLNGNMMVFFDALRHLTLPVIILSAQSWSTMLRIMRSSMLETMRQDYIRTARSKGLREHVVIRRHARRNALLPVVTMGGLWMAYLMGGVIVIETVFNYNGLGRFAAQAASQLDFPAVLGFVLFFATILVVINLLIDLLYAVLDPRVRLD